MPLRKTGLSLAITVAILLVLGLLASAHRQTRPASGTDAATTWTAPGDAAALAMTSPGADTTPDNPLHQPSAPRPEWEVLPACRLAPNKTNAAHHFHTRRQGSDAFVFQLYCVQAPEITVPTEEDIDQWGRYFGFNERMSEKAKGEALLRLGTQAWTAVERLLQEREFLVLTKWKQPPGSHHYYALVFFKDDEGALRSLQEWLVEQGYAQITTQSLDRLPTGESLEQFVARLERQQQVAQTGRRGGWGQLAARR